MKTINHEYYVSLEVAKLLKQAGFDWECNYYYFTQDGKTELKSNFNYPARNYNESMAIMDSKSFEFELYSRPTLEVAQRWLREVKEIDVIVTYEAVLNEKTDVYEKKYAVVVYDTFIEEDNNYHDTYEEAQEAGIKKALEIILEKNANN